MVAMGDDSAVNATHPFGLARSDAQGGIVRSAHSGVAKMRRLAPPGPPGTE